MRQGPLGPVPIPLWMGCEPSQSTRLGLLLLSFALDISERGTHLKSEPWNSLVQVTLALCPSPQPWEAARPVALEANG